jgi:hypothetical protein
MYSKVFGITISKRAGLINVLAMLLHDLPNAFVEFMIRSERALYSL